MGTLNGNVLFCHILIISLLMNRVSPINLGALFTVFIICGFSGMLGGMLS